MKLERITELVDGALYRDGPDIIGVAPLDEAGPGELAVFSDRRYASALRETRASAVLMSAPRPELPFAQIIHPEPMLALIRLLELFHPPRAPEPGISERADVSSSARVGQGVVIGPFVRIEDEAEVGDRTVIAAGSLVGRGATIGPGCHLHPRVVVMPDVRIGREVTIQSGTVIGADGFGYRWDGAAHRKVPQVGTVVIEDKVEIGANCTIDRATMGRTVIGAGTRLDNQVHVGHNARIGRNCLLIAQVGISGSVKVGDEVVLAGQVGVADHAEIGEGAIIVGQSGVHGRVGPGAVVAGTPIMPHAVWRKVAAVLPRLPEMWRIVRRLDRKFGD